MKGLFLGVMAVLGIMVAPAAVFASDIEVGVGPVLGADSGEIETEFFGKLGVLDIGDKGGLSIRSSINTASDLNIGGSLDYKVSDKTEVYLGGGYNVDLNDTADEGAYVGPGITHQVGKNIAVNGDAKYLFEREDVAIRLGLVYQF